MKSLLLIAILATAAIAVEDSFPIPEDDNIGFVFELVRHGARAPLIDDGDAFSIPTGNLTQSGMRQRYLVGRMIRQKYIEDYKLIDDLLTAEQVYMQTSRVFRVIQSTFSQASGFFLPKTSNQKLTDGEFNSLSSGKGMPPFGVNLGAELNDRLGKDALVDGISQFPVFTYSEYTMEDDILYDGCDYVRDCDNYYWDSPDAFVDLYDRFYTTLRDPLQASFDLSDEEADALEFNEIYNYCDVLVSEDFQGMEPRYDFTAEEWFHVLNVQKWMLTLTFPHDCRTIMDTKFMRFPIVKLKEAAAALLEGTASADDLKYIMYSAHDTQVSNLLEFFAFDNSFYYQIPYASNIYFELHYSQKCLDESPSEDCLTVQVIHNGQPMWFEGCTKNEQFKRNGPYDSPFVCSYHSFLEHFDSVRHEGSISQACSKEFEPFEDI